MLDRVYLTLRAHFYIKKSVNNMKKVLYKFRERRWKEMMIFLKWLFLYEDIARRWQKNTIIRQYASSMNREKRQ